MKTKNEHTEKFIKNENGFILNLFYELAQLKNLYRQGWVKNGVPESECETVAEHSFNVAFLSYIVAEEYFPQMDSQRAMMLGLFHEVGEIYIGDITPTDGITKEEKMKIEAKAVHKVLEKLPKSEKYIKIWEEYEHQTSKEAKLVKQMDRLEMCMQAELFNKKGFGSFDDFFKRAKEIITDKQLIEIFDNIRD